KISTGPQRPLEVKGAHFFHGSYSFPSAHTIESFALASVVAHQYQDNKAIVFLSYGLATLVGHRASARGSILHRTLLREARYGMVYRQTCIRKEPGRSEVSGESVIVLLKWSRTFSLPIAVTESCWPGTLEPA